MKNMTRRDFLYTTTVSAIALNAAGLKALPSNSFSFHCFSKHLQWLDYADTARVLKSAGYDGVDLTVRPGGHVEPERVEADLPRAVEAFRRQGLAVPMIVTAIKRADEKYAEKTLRTAQAMGVQIYRMGYLNYDKNAGIEASIQNLRPQVKELADMNREIGISGAYQNHAGTRIGGPVWDLRQLLKGIDKKYLGIQYDVKHATAEGSRSWILGLQLVAEHINCLALKDFLWMKKDNGTWRDMPVPMGTGMTDYELFYKTLKELNIICPITMHLEYQMPHQIYKDESKAFKIEKEIKVYKRDVDVVKAAMKNKGLIG